MSAERTPSLSTLSIHADNSHANRTINDIAPPIHVSTTFHYPRDPDALIPCSDRVAAAAADTSGKPPSAPYVYSRVSAPSTTRLEQVLSTLLHGPSTTYSSGLSAFHAVLVRVNPRRISIGGCYHGCQNVVKIFTRLNGLQVLPLDCAAEDLQPGDLIHLETPLNPDGTASSIREYAEKAHSRGAFLCVDGTFAPPPLQDPFLHGADYVMHSATKYIGGHSDMLGGVVAVRSEEEAVKLGWERMYVGSVMGGLEGWLGLRSIKTLELRVQRQSDSATRLARWLAALIESDKEIASVVAKVSHASLQEQEPWLLEQMPNGFGPVFSIHTVRGEQAKVLPSRLKWFHHATSLGGVESLVEWRAMTDEFVAKTVVRVSVGCEGWEDLRDDLERGLREVAQMSI
ncbi:Cys/Met metabolism PLP-dependent enzyme-domain-containing protein [Morchella snyderi]|nr:Cys/Met metabolism PLP-dependent enzyme-domain-containing protein [Morchella snyderi]